MAKRVCSRPGCPTLVDVDDYRGLCSPCLREWDRARGTKAERGYGASYDRERRGWSARITAGEVVLCWRCHEPVGADFHLGHDDDRVIVGPEHPACNLRAAGKARHGLA